MAKVDQAQIDQFPGIASKIRSFGQELNSEFVTAYKSVIAMNADWYGQRYADLATEFNNLTKTLDDMFTLVVTEVPFNLETVANNYSNWDTGQNVCTAQQATIINTPTIEPSSATGIRFITESVTSTQSSVSANFDKASGCMNSIEQVLKSITWESESARVFKDKFDQMKKNIDEAIKQIKDSFGKSIKTTVEEMEAAETANTIN